MRCPVPPSAYGDAVLRVCYAVSGTVLGHARPIVLRVSYAMSGTDIGVPYRAAANPTCTPSSPSLS
eukprot:1444153-Rhodomonas_salina.1